MEFIDIDDDFIMDDESIYNLTKEFGLDESEINEDELKDIMLEI